MSCIGSEESGNFYDFLTNEKHFNGASRKQKKTAPVK
jgi:hypothetical protein